MKKQITRLLKLPYKIIGTGAFLLSILYTPSQAQTIEFSRPSWWFGVAAGANLNFYNGSTQKLDAGFRPPVTFHKGFGVGLFAAPLVEYYRPGSRWGVMLQGGYDGRSGSFGEETSPCNCPANLSTRLSYISIEPSLRFAPFRSGLYLFAGPRFAFNISKEFTYSQGINPAHPEQKPNPDVKGDLSSVNASLVSMQIGAGYDIRLSPVANRNQWMFSPFVSFHPYFGQDPRSTETWNVTTIRVGAAIKFGRGRQINPPLKPKNATALTGAGFYVNSPENIPVERRVRETFPLRNYVFFNLGSTEIPDRYVLITKKEVPDFKEDQLEVFAPKTLSGRSEREMIVYYNILNILGDRMGKNPTATINLVGSSELGPEDGLIMAASVKAYLVDVWSINPARITTQGSDKPKIPSEQPGGELELKLLREGDRRVSIESTSPDMLMEFQSGPDAPLKPVEIAGVQQAPLNSYVSFQADGGKEAFTSWSLEITDDKGTVQHFGPYTQKKVSIPGKTILGTLPEGNYHVQMTGVREDGSKVIKDTTVHMVLWTPPGDEEGMRYSILYEFNKSKAIAMYEKYLTEVVVPKIPIGATVVIHGHTDIIGDGTYNGTLSMARAMDVKGIMEKALKKAGRKDVKFDVYGFGEDPDFSPFDNEFPEERFYNRTVIIDIIPN